MDKVRFVDRERVNLTDLLAFFGLSEDFLEFFLTTVVGDGLVIYNGLTVEETSTPSGQVEITVGTGFFNGTPLRVEAIQTANILDGTPSLPANRATAGTWATGVAADATNPRNDIIMIRWEENGEESFVRFFIDDTVSPPTEAPSTINTRLNDFFDIIVVRGTPAASPVDPSTTTQEAAGYTKLARVTVAALATTIVNADIDDSTSVPIFPPGASVGVPPIEDIFPIDHALLTNVTSDQHHAQVHAIDGADHTGSLDDDEIVSVFSGTNFLDAAVEVQAALTALDVAIAAAGAHTPNDEAVVTAFTTTSFLDGLTDQEAVNEEIDLILDGLAAENFIEGCEVRWASVATVTIQPGTIAVEDATDIFVRKRANADATLTVNIATDFPSGHPIEAIDTWYYIYAVVTKTDAQGALFTGGISATAPGADMLLASPPTGEVWRFVGTVRNDGSSNFIKFFHKGDEVIYEDGISVFTDATPTATLFENGIIAIAAEVPTTSTRAIITAAAEKTDALQHDFYFAQGDKTGSSGGHLVFRLNNNAGTTLGGTNTVRLDTDPDQNIAYRSDGDADLRDLEVWVNGYIESLENLSE